ncbi:hypothetical protein [Burkholderia gladioli]|uniref:hypothetical protein n=1 Tax=Burkholderia gladioli TaxID=28095 RepID=UPI000B309036|nr:hypothetical protein [Burkholderia gladioli]
MNRLRQAARGLSELFALWIVIASILFLVVWLVLPQLGFVPADDQPQPVHSTSARTA